MHILRMRWDTRTSWLARGKPGPYIDGITAVDAITQCPQRSQSLQERLPAKHTCRAQSQHRKDAHYIVPFANIAVETISYCDMGEQVNEEGVFPVTCSV